ncbi:MAG TPA: hypothetical protein VFS21_11600 [Roseiflexaceae bacterium]|nr:hypothetical protein [Roseiflexaceae bacterium]
MTPEALRQRLQALWPLPWRIDPGATDPAVVTADVGALSVAVGLTQPLTVVGVLGDEDFYEEQTDDLPAALAELDRALRARVALN